MADVCSDDYYRVLGVERDAGAKQLASAYKKLALLHHPDKNLDDKENAEEKFKRITEAYDVLRDPEKRKVYDEFGKAGPHGNPGQTASGNFAGGGAGDGTDDGPNFGSGSFYHGPGGMTRERADNIFNVFFGGGDPFATFFSGGVGNDGNMPFSFAWSGNNGGNMFMCQGMNGSGFPNASMDNGFRARSSGTCRGVRPGSSAGFRRGSRERTPAGSRQGKPGQLPLGAAVVVRDLEKAPEHNGRVGRVVGWDQSHCRVRVEFEAPSSCLSFKRQNLTQLCSAEVEGLESKPELNGTLAKIVKYDSKRRRYTVLAGEGSSTLGLQPGNCILPEGSAVVIQGLVRGSFNGQMAQIVGIDRAARRYTVQCQDGQLIKVKYDNVLC